MTSHPNTFLPKNQNALSFRQTRQKSQDENLIKVQGNSKIPQDENKENLTKNIVVMDHKNVNKNFFLEKLKKNFKEYQKLLKTRIKQENLKKQKSKNSQNFP